LSVAPGALRVGVVGLGRWGQVLVRAAQEGGLETAKLLQIVAGYSRTPAKVEGFTHSSGIELFPSYDEMIGAGKIDAVLIASPHSQHASQAGLAAAQGLHVFCEKPLALDRHSAATAVSACREAGRVLAVGFNRRFLPAYRRMAELVASQRLGRILHVEGNFSGPFGLGYKPGVWHADRSETPGGGLTLMGVHVLDAMIGLVGNVVGASARSRRQVLQVELDDTTDVLLDFQSGATGYLSTLTATTRQWRLQVFGTAGWAQMIDQDRLIVSIDGEAFQDVTFPTISTERAELECFARAALFGESYPVPNDDVLNGLEALDAIFQSLGSLGR